jgi:hypothetical protein
VLPFPSRPRWPFPQHRTVPSSTSAHVCALPSASAVTLTPLNPTTAPGFSDPPKVGAMLPSPSCPYWLRPQHHTLPSVRTAQVCSPPVAIIGVTDGVTVVDAAAGVGPTGPGPTGATTASIGIPARSASVRATVRVARTGRRAADMGASGTWPARRVPDRRVHPTTRPRRATPRSAPRWGYPHLLTPPGGCSGVRDLRWP